MQWQWTQPGARARMAREVVTETDNLAVSFPSYLDTKVGLNILKTYENLETLNNSSLISGQGYTSRGSNLD